MEQMFSRGSPNVYLERVLQECIRLVIEPILEAQFFNHSYGFRPYRDAHMALERVTDVVHKTGYYWVVEGDIRRYFDTINHTKLLKQLWHLGIRDRRVLLIIKQMLKAGVMNETEVNTEGAPQGGIISPLLANVYLNVFDWSIAKAWEEKQTRYPYATKSIKYQSLKKRSKLKPAYLVRYCDDWVLITDTKANAQKWKNRLQKYLQTQLKLTLSDEKTKITCVKKKTIEFLGFTYKVVPSGIARKGYATRTRPNPVRLKSKMIEIRKQVKRIGKRTNFDLTICQIHKVNSIIRGLINYYQAATQVNSDLNKYACNVSRLAFWEIKKLGGKLVPANQANNLMTVHSQYLSKIPAVKYYNQIIGVTSFSFCKWHKTRLKNQNETPFTSEGREWYRRRTGKRETLPRNDELLSNHLMEKIIHNRGSSKYNFEYFLNCGYALNRDKGKCRICKVELNANNIEFHHIQEHFPFESLNRVPNLASVCKACHVLIHSTRENLKLSKTTQNKLTRMRKKLNNARVEG
jgi:RNA-directed DNA polymerase